jgi:hypothetical protein
MVKLKKLKNTDKETETRLLPRMKLTQKLNEFEKILDKNNKK